MYSWYFPREGLAQLITVQQKDRACTSSQNGDRQCFWYVLRGEIFEDLIIIGFLCAAAGFVKSVTVLDTLLAGCKKGSVVYSVALLFCVPVLGV